MAKIRVEAASLDGQLGEASSGGKGGFDVGWGAVDPSWTGEQEPQGKAIVREQFA